jgi:hypothetical protein
MLDKIWFGERRVPGFIDDGRGRTKRSERRHQLQQLNIKALAGRHPPARVVRCHIPGIWSGRSGGMKRVKMVLSGCRPARIAVTGKTFSIHGVGQGPWQSPAPTHRRMRASRH